MSTQKIYTFESNDKIASTLDHVTQQRDKIENNKPLKNGAWGAIYNKLKIDWTYNSNAIEGSTLTYGETVFFLQEGLTVEGKPFKDFLDARNHAEAIDFLMEVIKNEREISEGLIKEINALLLSGVKYTEAMDQFGQKVKKPATPGEYKKLPNHVLQMDGTIHYYVEPLQVPAQMKEMCAWVNTHLDTLHPVVVSAIAHYNFVRIHPFDDGNGRGARILMNLILMRKGYPVAIVKNEKRRQYLTALREADHGDLSSFVLFIAESLQATQYMILDEIAKSP